MFVRSRALISSEKVYSIIYLAYIIALSGVFFNVLIVDDNLYDSTRTGKMIFIFRYLIMVIPLSMPLLIFQIRKALDGVTIFTVIFFLWICLVGKPGGIWLDVKFLYMLAAFCLFFAYKHVLSLERLEPSWFKGYWIPVTVISLIGGLEATIGQLQVINEYHIYHSSFRISGTFFNPAPYAGFLVACFPYMLLIATTNTKNIWYKLFSLMGLLCCMAVVAILPSTQSRAAWFGFLFAGLIWLRGYYGNQLAQRVREILKRVADGVKSQKIKQSLFEEDGGIRKKWLTIALGVMFSSVILLGYVIYEFKKDSADGRLLIWKVSSSMIGDAPLLGHGFNTFQANYAPALAEYFESGKGSDNERVLAGNVQWAFDEPLQWTVELGIPGGLIFVGLVLYALLFRLPKEIETEKKVLVYSARASVLGIFIFGLFSYPFYSASTTLLFFFALSILANYSPRVKLKAFSVLLNAAFIIAMISFVVFVFIKIPHIKNAYWLWDEAESLYNITQYELANQSFEEALPVLERNGAFMQHYGKSLQMSGKNEKAVQVLNQGGRFYKDDFWYIILADAHRALDQPKKAEQYYETASKMVPHKLFAKYLLAKLYNDTGQKSKAKSIAQAVLDSETKVMSTAVDEIRREMEKILEGN